MGRVDPKDSMSEWYRMKKCQNICLHKCGCLLHVCQNFIRVTSNSKVVLTVVPNNANFRFFTGGTIERHHVGWNGGKGKK